MWDLILLEALNNCLNDIRQSWFMTCLVDPKRMIVVSHFYFILFVILLKHIIHGFWWGHFLQLLRTFVKIDDPHRAFSFPKIDGPLKATGSAPPSMNQRVSLPWKLMGVLSDGRPLSDDEHIPTEKKGVRTYLAFLVPHKCLYKETSCISREKNLLLIHISLIWKDTLQSWKP